MPQVHSRWLADSAVLPSAPRGRRSQAAAGWFAEGFTPNEYHCHRMKAVLRSARTAYQDCVLADTHSYGRCLVLDGEMQSARADEFIYHESLVQPALAVHPRPSRILILGGGEGATAREALRHRSVERLVMADIDGEVLNFARRWLGEWHRGAFDDPRVRVLVEDARRIVEGSALRFDAVFSDLPSAIEGGPAYRLYTIEFYRALRRRLAPGGVFALQAGSGHLLQLDFHKTLVNTLRRVFRVVRPYYAYVPSFDVPWAFCLCSDDARLDPLGWDAPAINARLRRRGARGLRFLDGEAFEGLFRTPRYLRALVDGERRVISEKRPVYFFK